MLCVITAGPTYEPLDGVRRLTNFSTGRLGTQLANYLTANGHTVILLKGKQATYWGDCIAKTVELFDTTSDLGDKLCNLSGAGIGAVFHAAAVSDFKFGRVWTRSETDQLIEICSEKIPTGHGTLLAELVPTAKLIGHLRNWFPAARLFGWKFEVEGDRANAIALAQKQIHVSRTDVCIANGPAYGSGFGLVSKQEKPVHVENEQALFQALISSLVRT